MRKVLRYLMLFAVSAVLTIIGSKIAQMYVSSLFSEFALQLMFRRMCVAVITVVIKSVIWDFVNIKQKNIRPFEYFVYGNVARSATPLLTSMVFFCMNISAPDVLISIGMAEAIIVDLSTVVYVQYKNKTLHCWQTYCLVAIQILYFVLCFSNVI